MERCYASDKNLAMHDFIYMISTIHLRVAVIRQVHCIFSEHLCSTLDLREVQNRRLTHNQVLCNIQCDKSCMKSLWHYFHDGAKYCLLAGGGKFVLYPISVLSTLASSGTIFLLAIMAVARQQSVHGPEFTQDVILRLNHLLRCPTTGTVSLSVFLSRMFNLSWKYRSSGTGCEQQDYSGDSVSSPTAQDHFFYNFFPIYSYDQWNFYRR